MTWRGMLTAFLLVAAVVTGWSAWRQRAEPAPSIAAAGRPDYVLHDFELIALDAAGNESFTLRAPRLARDPDDETLSLQTPLFLVPDDDPDSDGRWTMRSQTGWVSADSSEVRLRGDVVAESPPGASPTTLKTEQLNLFPDKDLATSDVVVAVISPGTTMQGTGMRAHLDEERIELLSKVSITDDPSRR